MDIITLKMKVNTAEVDAAERDLRNLRSETQRAEAGFQKFGQGVERSAKQASTATASLAVSLRSLIGPLVTLQAFTGFINIARSAETMQASLVTATGSVEDATIAFEALQEFAATTPFSLEQVTQAFIKLTNLGLTPSRAAITSYGNTAAAMGKSLNDFIEAVADAATGEFERLKEFGIRAKSQGDQVTFIFRGVSTTVAKESSAIESYLQNIGNTDFAGGMERQADTLSGAISNLGDEFNALVTRIGNAGATDVMTTIVRGMTDLLKDFGDWLMTYGVTPFQMFGRTVIGTMMGAEDGAKTFLGFIGGSFITLLNGALMTAGMLFSQLWDSIARGVQEMAFLLGKFAQDVKAVFSGIWDVMSGRKGIGESVLNTAGRLGRNARALTDSQLQADDEMFKRMEQRNAEFQIAWQNSFRNPPRQTSNRTDDPLARFRVGGNSKFGTDKEKKKKDVTETPEYRQAMSDARDRSDARNREYDNINDFIRDSQMKALEETRKQNEELRKQADAYRVLIDPIRELDAEILKIYANTELTREEQDKAAEAVTLRFMEYGKEIKDVSNNFDYMQRVGESAFKGIEDSLMSFLETGKFSFKNFIASLLLDLARLTIQLQLIKPLMAGLGLGDAKGMGGNVIFDFLKNSPVGNIFGGAKAKGGDVIGGRPILVGERGEELFIPHSNGTVIPNHAMQRASGVNQTFSVTVNVKGGQSNAETGQVVSQAVVKAMQEVARAEIVRQRQYGGALYA